MVKWWGLRKRRLVLSQMFVKSTIGVFMATLDTVTPKNDSTGSHVFSEVSGRTFRMLLKVFVPSPTYTGKSFSLSLSLIFCFLFRKKVLASSLVRVSNPGRSFPGYLRKTGRLGTSRNCKYACVCVRMCYV